jgi:hypothetical protein
MRGRFMTGNFHDTRMLVDSVVAYYERFETCLLVYDSTGEHSLLTQARRFLADIRVVRI